MTDPNTPLRPAPAIASPCVGLCRLDDGTGLCLGCARTGAEIAAWRERTDAWRRAVWDRLPGRFDRLGIVARRLPWGREEIAAHVARTLRERAGTWILGVHGAVGEFNSDPDEPLSVHVGEEAVEATSPRAAIRLRIDGRVRALEIHRGDDRPPMLVLAVPRARLSLPVNAGLTALGPDGEAIRSEDRARDRFDLGLGRRVGRFTLRLAAGDLADRLNACEGMALDALLARHGAALVAESPARVVETALGRVEVATPIPPPGGRSPEGPHTHLLPDQLRAGRESPIDPPLPDAYAPGAVLHPGSG